VPVSGGCCCLCGPCTTRCPCGACATGQVCVCRGQQACGTAGQRRAWGVRVSVHVVAEGFYIVDSGATGAFEAMCVMGAGYFSIMMLAALTLKRPAPGYRPDGYVPAPPIGIKGAFRPGAVLCRAVPRRRSEVTATPRSRARQPLVFVCVTHRVCRVVHCFSRCPVCRCLWGFWGFVGFVGGGGWKGIAARLTSCY
jgi:hypothetical protein